MHQRQRISIIWKIESVYTLTSMFDSTETTVGKKEMEEMLIIY